MTKIIVTKNSPRYLVVDANSYLVNLKDLDADEFLSLTENDNFNGLIEKHGVEI